MVDSTVDTPQFKTCTNPDCSCENPQPLEDFHRDKTKSGGRRSRCKTCENKRDRSGYNHAPIDPVVRNERNRERRARNRERDIERRRQWKINNPDLAREHNRRALAKRDRKRHREYNRGWQREHKEYRSAKSKRRADRKKSLPNTYSDFDWQRALDYFKGCCAVCGRPPGLWHIIVPDHWIPLANPDCPGTIPTNIVPLCNATKGGEGGCNNTKIGKEPNEWLFRKFGEIKAQEIMRRIQEYFDSLGYLP